MMLARPLRAVAMWWLISFAGILAASAQTAAPGQLRATAFHPLPPAAAIAVRPLDDSPANLELRASMIAALVASGRALAADSAGLVLEFESEVEGLASGREPRFGSGVTTNRETRLKLNMWSNNEDSVLTGRAPGSERRGTVRYLLRATLAERGGQRLWQGEAVYDRATADDMATLKAMAPKLIEALGRTVRAGSFAIDAGAARD